MPTVATVGDSGTLSLSRMRGGSEMGGGNINLLNHVIIPRFLVWDARARSCLGRIGTGARCCVKPRLISGEGLTLKHCVVETHGSRKWEPPPHEETSLIPGRGDSIFINQFLLRDELSSDIMTILECTNRTESGMRTLFSYDRPQKSGREPRPT